MPSQQRTLEQKRAAQAWDDVTKALDQARKAAEIELAKVRQENNQRRIEEVQKALNRLQDSKGIVDFKGKYGTLVRKTPAMISSAGLGQTLAFLRSKGKNDEWDEHIVLYRQVSGWVVNRLTGSAGDLLEIVRQQSSEVYRQATAEALAFLGWLKRFAEAELPEAEGE